MKKIAKYVSALVLCLIAGVVLTACGKTKITSAHIKSGTIATTIVKNEQLDTSNAVAVIEYSNDTVKEVGSNELTFGTIDTSTTGTKDLTVTYDGFNFTVKIKVVATEADVSVVTSFSSDLLTEFKANSGEKLNEREEFVQKNKVQLVGDDNALDFRINAKGVDGNGNLVEDLTKVRTQIKFEEVGGTDVQPTYRELTDAEVEQIALVNTENTTIDFVDGVATGKTYRITVSAVNYDPIYFDKQNPASFTATVKVVDGYNVYTAEELSVLDNTNTENGWTALKQAWGLENVNPKSVVLQRSLTITDAVLPARNFYTQQEVDNLPSADKEKTNQPIVGSLKDSASADEGLYLRNVLDDEEFNLYGNYFDIDFSQVSRIVIDGDKKGVSVPETDGEEPEYITTHTPALRVTGAKLVDENRVNVEIGETSQGTGYIKDVYFIGNGERSSDPLASGGLILLKSKGVNFTADNVIQKDFTIGYFPEYGYNLSEEGIVGDEALRNVKNEGNPNLNSTFNFLNCKGYNNYSSIAYLWGCPKVYFENCDFVGAGGPVMIVDHVTSSNNYNKLTGEGGYATNVDVVNSNLESLVKGEEPWFRTYNGATSAVKSLTLADAAYANVGKTFLTTSNEGISGVMNMLFIFKFGAKEFSLSPNVTRGYARVFNTVEDYESYYTTGKLADGKTTYYGYDRTKSYDSSGNYFYKDKNAADNFSSDGPSGSLGRLVASTSGEAFVIKGQSGAPTGYNFGNGKFLNVYLSNGFGSMLELYDKSAQ